MIVLPHTSEDLDKAVAFSKSMGRLNNSITGGQGNVAGFVGEIVLANFLGAKRADQYGFDLLKGKRRIEVKTKRRTVDPQPDYEGSVAVTSEHQKPTMYAFMSITYESKKYDLKEIVRVWLCGVIPYEKFIQDSKFYKKGEIDPSNGFVVLTDMRNIPYSELFIPRKIN